MIYLYANPQQKAARTPFDTVALSQVKIGKVQEKGIAHGFVTYTKSTKDGYTFVAATGEESHKWRVKLKESAAMSGSRLFGVPLHVSARKSKSGRIPDILEVCAKYLQSVGMAQEGIFRLSGSASKVAALQESFDKGLLTIPPHSDIHDVTGVMKKYLRDLPIPLVVFEHYDTFVNAWSEDVDATKLNLVRAVQKLPPVHRSTLGFLMLFLHDLGPLEEKTKMGYHNLAVVFAPTILK